MDLGQSQTVEFILPATVAGRYAVLRKVGAGGMGETYLAEDHLLKREVILKRVLPSTIAPDPEALNLLRSRLLSEAKRACAIHSPYVAQVYDVLESDAELLLVIEFIEGGSLRALVGQPLPLPRFLQLAIQLAEALRASHAAFVVHCDLKPENILLDKAGTAKVIDFGLARLVVREGYQGNTLSVQQLEENFGGTPGYMAPETLRYEPPTERSDIFSLGVVFYELLTSQNPFRGANFTETVDRTLHAILTPPSRIDKTLPAALDRILLAMLERDPQQRTASAADLLATLRHLESGDPGSFPGAHRSTAWPASQRKRIFAAALVLALLVPAGWYGARRSKDRAAATYASRDATVPAGTRLLAVLPFDVIGKDDRLQAYGEGLRHTITGSLTHVSAATPLQVLGASELRAHPINSAAEARLTYGVDLVVDGSLEQHGSTVRIIYSLVDARTMRPLQSETVTSSMDDPFALEDRIVNGVLRMVAGGHTAAAEPGSFHRGTTSASAYDEYLRGVGYLRDFEDTQNNERALNSFRRAVAEDPGFVRAYAQMGLAYWNMYLDTKDVSLIERAKSACNKSLSMQADEPEAQICLATIATGTGHPAQAVKLLNSALAIDPRSDVAMNDLANAYETLGEAPEAEKVYQRAVNEKPQYWAHYYDLASFFVRQTRYREAVAVLETALRLSPDNSLIYRRLGVTQYLLGDYDAAGASLEKALRVRPTAMVYIDLGEVYVHKQQYDKAAEAFESALRQKPGSMQAVADLADAESWSSDPHARTRAPGHYLEASRLAREALRVNAQSVDALLVLAYAQAALGHKAESEKLIRTALTHSPEDAEVLIYAARTSQRNGNSPAALAWIKKAIDSHYSKEDIATTPDFAAFRGNPEFEAALQKP